VLRTVHTLAVVTLLGGFFPPASARADEPWKVYANKDGVSYARRAVSGSRFYEYRAEVLVPAPPARVLDAIWRGITETIPKTVKKRTVLSRSDSEFLVYDQLDPPVVKDRDVTIQIRKRALASGGVEVAFVSVSALGPPPNRDYVRIPAVRGAWTLEPAAGGTQLTYHCYSEPGGSVPAFLVRGVQQDQVAEDVERILSRLRGH
jgi:hypothetical protein